MAQFNSNNLPQTGAVAPFKDWDEFLEWVEDNPDDAISYFEQKYPDLADKARHADLVDPPPELRERILKQVADLLAVKPDSLYGRAYVTEELVADSKMTAGALTVANGWNIATTIPLLFIAFKDLPLGALLALLAAVGILKFSNDCGAIAAANQPAKKGWARAGLIGLVGMNVGLTAISGPGTELAMNQAKLSDRLAQELVEERVLPPYQAPLKRVQELLQQGSDLKRDCERETSQFRSLPISDPRRDSLYIKLFGLASLQSDSKHWESVATEQLPLCRRGDRVISEGERLERQSKADLDNQMTKINRLGGPLPYLENEVPTLFAANFTPNSEVKSGVTAARLAIAEFSDKVARGEWSSLGFALVSFGISVITSGAAVYMTLAHANRRDVARSYDQEIIRARQEFFHRLDRGLR